MTAETEVKSRLLSNKALCLHCDEVIESKHRHDFVKCSCGSIGADGGTDYIRRLGDPSDYIDMCVYGNTHNEYINNLRWGRNYDKDMNPLKETEWILIKDLSIDHIKAIVEGGFANTNPFYYKMFLKELENRLI